jgi:hypothetical protein
MNKLPTPRRRLRKLAWLVALAPFAAGFHDLQAQGQSRRPGLGQPDGVTAMGVPGLGNVRTTPSPNPGTGQPPPSGNGTIIFNDQSPVPSGHDLSQSSYVGFHVCAGCHGRLTSTRRDHTIIQEWESNPTANAHARDAAAFNGSINIYSRTVSDGLPVQGTVKSCAVCHTVGAPKFDESQSELRNGYDPNQPFNDYKHNVFLLRVQCENCHGPGSQHVLSGGDTRFINRVPDAKQTCWNCHVHEPNEKGNIPKGPATDDQIALYKQLGSLGHTHGAGFLIAATGGYEYAGESYTEGHNFPHTKIRDTCVTCHVPRDPNSPILDHSSIQPKITACRNCHSDARNVASIDDWQYLQSRQDTVTNLLIQLGGATAAGGPDFNAGGGLLGNAKDKTSSDYKRARWNYAVVINDGSFGAHNYDYAIELLTTSIKHAPAQK